MMHFPAASGLLAMVVGLASLTNSPAARHAAPPGNAANGERLFNRRCASCHALVEHRDGPRLGNVYGRRAGSTAGFQYSVALGGQTFAWSDSTLDRFLAGPRDFVPGTAMKTRIGNAEERDDIIAYLRMLAPTADSTRTPGEARDADASGLSRALVPTPAHDAAAAIQRRKK